MNKIAKFVLFSIFLLVCTAGLVLSFVFQYNVSDPRIVLVLNFVGAITSALIGISFQYYVVLWGDILDYTPWSPAVRSLIRNNEITKDTDFRISYGYLFRVCVNGKYLLIRDNHKISDFKVPGGTYLISESEKYKISKEFKVREDDQYCTRDVPKNDYRLIVPARNLVPVYRRFSKNPKEDIGEAFVQNLVIGRDLLPQDIFNKVVATFVRRDVVIKYPKHFKYFEMVLADIYEVSLTQEQKDYFMDYMEKAEKEEGVALASEELTGDELKPIVSSKLRFATAEEIRRRGVYAEKNQLTASISDHSYKILPNLPRRKTPIEY